MHTGQITLCLLAFGSSVSGGRLRQDQVMWGRYGRPTTVRKVLPATTAPAARVAAAAPVAVAPAAVASAASVASPKSVAPAAALAPAASVAPVKSIAPAAPLAPAASLAPSSSSTWPAPAASAAVAVGVGSAAPAGAAVPDAVCKNGPMTRNCWAQGFSIESDFDEKWPNTGSTKSYSLEITNSTCNFDGQTRDCLLINGQYPGPKITADWGDKLSISVKNSLTNNGTGIHWHGVRQWHTPSQDGVPGITECPLAPGDTKVYNFQATQHGTSWYHSHWSSQYGEGIVGTLQINGPATANYDVDLGTFPVTDWWSRMTVADFADQANAALQKGQAPPPADTVLVNGTTKGPLGGKYSETELVAGKKYRLRLINTSLESTIRVSLDNHPFLVVAADFVPVKPFPTEWITLAIGQRYDVIINANQTAGAYWFRANNAPQCTSSANNNSLAIFSYGATTEVPTSTGFTEPTACTDVTSQLVPKWETTVPSADFISQAHELEVNLAIPNVTTNTQNIVSWTVNFTTIDVNWEDPTLQYVAKGDTNYTSAMNMIEIPSANTWTYWIIQEPGTSPVKLFHPVHLHGHDFWVLGSGLGIFDPKANASSLVFDNPPRRDVVMLPSGGWVVLAFVTDNPGAWLMHCHIGSHIAAGLGTQFLESKSLIEPPDAAWSETCANWERYYSTSEFKEDDSGL